MKGKSRGGFSIFQRKPRNFFHRAFIRKKVFDWRMHVVEDDDVIEAGRVRQSLLFHTRVLHFKSEMSGAWNWAIGFRWKWSAQKHNSWVNVLVLWFLIVDLEKKFQVKNWRISISYLGIYFMPWYQIGASYLHRVGWNTFLNGIDLVLD